MWFPCILDLFALDRKGLVISLCFRRRKHASAQFPAFTSKNFCDASICRSGWPDTKLQPGSRKFRLFWGRYILSNVCMLRCVWVEREFFLKKKMCVLEINGQPFGVEMASTIRFWQRISLLFFHQDLFYVSCVWMCVIFFNKLNILLFFEKKTQVLLDMSEYKYWGKDYTAPAEQCLWFCFSKRHFPMFLEGFKKLFDLDFMYLRRGQRIHGALQLQKKVSWFQQDILAGSSTFSLDSREWSKL